MSMPRPNRSKSKIASTWLLLCWTHAELPAVVLALADARHLGAVGHGWDHVKGAKRWFRHAAARWYSWRSPPSRSRRSIAACGGGGVGGWLASGGWRPSARCGRSVL